jgi:hypothetical protein
MNSTQKTCCSKEWFALELLYSKYDKCYNSFFSSLFKRLLFCYYLNIFLQKINSIKQSYNIVWLNNFHIESSLSMRLSSPENGQHQIQDFNDV